MILIFIYLMIDDVEYFSCTCWHYLCLFLGKCMFRSFAHFVTSLFQFLLLSCKNYIYILYINCLSGNMVHKLFSHFMVCLSSCMHEFILRFIVLFHWLSNFNFTPVSTFCFLPSEKTRFRSYL